ncbi:MAG: DUF1146 domain-containing protein [Bacilli bacterium]|nr:DUF1146 domain-containing protein [Bacilli bacterium]MDD4795113.1 DUF1146 domain-containing protein [Bacilli bacterium]
MYKALIYAISVLISVYALSGINFNNFFKKNHELEAKTLIIILSFALGYLLASFVINFLEYSRIL